jgi:hypothetical protein
MECTHQTVDVHGSSRSSMHAAGRTGGPGGGKRQSLMSLLAAAAAAPVAAAPSVDPAGQSVLPPATPRAPPPEQYAFARQSAGTSGAAAAANQPGRSLQSPMLLAFCADVEPAGHGVMPSVSGLAAVPAALAVPTRPEPGQ